MRVPPLALLAVLLLSVSAIASSSASASTLVGGAQQNGAPLIISPLAGGQVSQTQFSMDPRAIVIQRMPSTKDVVSVTLGDLSALDACSPLPSFGLRVRESLTGSETDVQTIATAVSSQTIGFSHGRVTWTIPQTRFHEGRLYRIELVPNGTGCRATLRTSRAPTEQALMGGSTTCEPLTALFAGTYRRAWSGGSGVSTPCGNALTGEYAANAAAIPTGWLLMRNGGLLTAVKASGSPNWISNNCFFGATPQLWFVRSDGLQEYACVMAQFVARGATSAQGWFWAVDGGEQLSVPFVSLMTANWSGGPLEQEYYGPPGDGSPTGSWNRAPSAPEMYGQGNPANPNQGGCHGGDPVDCATGNLTETITDVALTSRGVPLTLERSYNALAAAASVSGPFGRGWSSSFTERLALEDERLSVLLCVRPRSLVGSGCPV